MPFKKVYAVTPNPALDLSGEAAQIVANEKNYVIKEKRYAGGNAVNAARILTRLQYPVVASGFLGGVAGQQIQNFLDEEGVQTDFVAVDEETRVNVTVANRASHQQTRFSFPGSQIKQSEKKSLLKKLSAQTQGSLFMLGGSFPPHFKVSDAKKILALGHTKKIATIVDIPSQYLRALLPAKPLMIKPNLFEFEQLVGRKLTGLPSIIAEAKKLLKFCPVICISSVSQGVLLVTREASYFAEGSRVIVRSQVGAGDSLVGAMAAGMIQHRLSYEMFFNKIDPRVWPAILSLGMGAALATICQHGTSLGTKADILKYSKKIRVSIYR